MSDWKTEMSDFFKKSEEAKQKESTSELVAFIHDAVVPAFEELAREMGRHGREVVIRDARTAATLTVSCGGEEEMMYRVQGRRFPTKVLPYAEIRARERKGLKLIRVESMFRAGHDYEIKDLTKDEIIRNFLENYTRRVEPA